MPSGVRVRVSPGLPKFFEILMRKVPAAWAATGFETRDGIPVRDGGSTPQLSANFCSGAPGRAVGFQPQRTAFESSPECQVGSPNDMAAVC